MVSHLRAWIALQFVAICARGPSSIDLGVCLLPGCGIAQTCDRLEVRSPTLAIAGGLEGCIDICIGGRRSVRRQYADDGVRCTFQENRSPKNAAVRAEHVTPEAVAQNGCTRTVGTVLFRGEVTAHHRLN